MFNVTSCGVEVCLALKIVCSVHINQFLLNYFFKK